mmetsp:Transcript_22524/g.62855  ORF Transcript_22524/g.62855 Transcript_22524/m.62855 type:complete len:220 (-) Transcript_22524:713-1372(-)
MFAHTVILDVSLFVWCQYGWLRPSATAPEPVRIRARVRVLPLLVEEGVIVHRILDRFVEDAVIDLFTVFLQVILRQGFQPAELGLQRLCVGMPGHVPQLVISVIQLHCWESCDLEVLHELPRRVAEGYLREADISLYHLSCHDTVADLGCQVVEVNVQLLARLAPGSIKLDDGQSVIIFQEVLELVQRMEAGDRWLLADRLCMLRPDLQRGRHRRVIQL